VPQASAAVILTLTNGDDIVVVVGRYVRWSCLSEQLPSCKVKALRLDEGMATTWKPARPIRMSMDSLLIFPTMSDFAPDSHQSTYFFTTRIAYQPSKSFKGGGEQPRHCKYTTLNITIQTHDDPHLHQQVLI
jgi:hypothetical protein